MVCAAHTHQIATPNTGSAADRGCPWSRLDRQTVQGRLTVHKMVGEEWACPYKNLNYPPSSALAHPQQRCSRRGFPPRPHATSVISTVACDVAGSGVILRFFASSCDGS